ncbi:MAG: hypothetical protein LC670_07100 [Flavobacteriales bacterium]|nr:hypothetical protein [Flavobacteriales bacterium]
MCGIAGIWTRKGIENSHLEALDASSGCIARRGPDAEGVKTYTKAAFAHRRLSIIDTSARANQPMTDPSGRYCLVFNGEIYNHKALGADLSVRYGIEFTTSSDTEVLLHGLIHEGTDFLPKLNGFFAFALYDSERHHLTCARDRYGIKPFFYTAGDDAFAFGSSLTSVHAFCRKAEIDHDALATYLQLSYIPDPATILKGVKVITLLARREDSEIPAFSIGFPDNPYFDESANARAAARHIGVRHEVFEVREKDIEGELRQILDAIDEPFADSSAVLVNILSQRTRKEVKVALSGDGADELLGGYNKHRALLRSLEKGAVNRTLRTSAPVLGLLPASRSHAVFDRLRKIKRYSRGLKLDFADRYIEWASFTRRKDAQSLLLRPFPTGLHPDAEGKFTGLDPSDFNSVLRTDIGLVLANDMLCKVDTMSMHRALEVRVPFLDHRVVDFVLSLPASEKIDSVGGKKLLRKAFKEDFPPGFFDRGKRGFEAPLRHWMCTVLKPELDRLLAEEFLEAQGIFNITNILKLRRKAVSKNPGDSPHTLWAVFVFQHWWERIAAGKVLVK